MKEPQIVSFWEINASNGTELANFYTEVFEWDFDYNPSNDYHSFKTASSKGGINGGIFTGKGKLPPHLTIIVHVENIEDCVNRVRKCGGEILQEPFEIPGAGIASFFKDPEGNIIGMIQA